jgi:hypothetical protein
MKSIGWVVIACACSHTPGANVDGGTGGATPDADTCAGAVSARPFPGCVEGGLGMLSLDGMWTLTGTISHFAASPMPYTETLYLARGSGSCGFAISTSPITTSPHDPDVSYDDTIVSYSSSGYYPHSYSYSWQLCVSSTTGLLTYQERDTLSMPMMDTSIAGTLAR